MCNLRDILQNERWHERTRGVIGALGGEQQASSRPGERRRSQCSHNTHVLILFIRLYCSLAHHNSTP